MGQVSGLLYCAISFRKQLVIYLSQLDFLAQLLKQLKLEVLI